MGDNLPDSLGPDGRPGARHGAGSQPPSHPPLVASALLEKPWRDPAWCAFHVVPTLASRRPPRPSRDPPDP